MWFPLCTCAWVYLFKGYVQDLYFVSTWFQLFSLFLFKKHTIHYIITF